jgi:hypothetical protein
MLEDLAAYLPKPRKQIIYEELALLDISLRRVFPDTDDQALAATGDFQGIGGNRDSHNHKQIAPSQSRGSNKETAHDVARDIGRAG